MQPQLACAGQTLSLHRADRHLKCLSIFARASNGAEASGVWSRWSTDPLEAKCMFDG
jgi:hypothetical protein